MLGYKARYGAFLLVVTVMLKICNLDYHRSADSGYIAYPVR